MNLNSSPSPFPMHQVLHDNDSHIYHHPFAPTTKPSPSSSPTCHFFFDSTQDHDAGSFYDHPHRTFYRPLDDSYDYEGGSRYDHEIKSKVDRSLKLTLWKKEDDESSSIPMKWMSSKMRVMQKMKSPDGTAASSSDQKLQLSPSSETDMSCNTPIRVCSDCHTTKTPLWRSGPKGPKSLCNACGIRQRKARRAAAAAAAANVAGAGDHLPVVKIKVQQQREKSAAAGKIGHSSHLKKRCKTAAGATSAVGSGSNAQKKIGFEDFLINISKNLSFHRVFPEDEKDAAILLMALSSGLVNG